MKQAQIGQSGEGIVRSKETCLRICESFTSLNGEVNFRHQGSLAFFIRLAGCNLRCAWCDTKYAQEGDSYPFYTVGSVIREVPPVDKIPNVTITGGEPLLQEEPLVHVIEVLAKRGYYINIETNGTIPVPRIPHKLRSHVGWTIDVKLPSSGHNRPHTINNLPADMCCNDWLKFVIANGFDIQAAKRYVKAYRLEEYNIAFSPVQTGVQTRFFIQKLVGEAYGTAVISLQLHKLLGIR